MKQETVSGSGISWAICKFAPRSRQITLPGPHHSVFYRPDALPATQPTASKHWRHICCAINVIILWFFCKNSWSGLSVIKCVTFKPLLFTSSFCQFSCIISLSPQPNHPQLPLYGISKLVMSPASLSHTAEGLLSSLDVRQPLHQNSHSQLFCTYVHRDYYWH